MLKTRDEFNELRMQPTEQAIRLAISEISGVSPDIPGARDLYLEMGVASIHGLKLLARLEEEFGVAIPDEDFVEATSVEKLCALMETLVANRGVDA